MEKPSIIDLILDAYHDGVFPMADDAGEDEFAFYRPTMRGLLPIKDLHIPQKLLKIVKAGLYKITFDAAFERIIDGCAMQTKKRNKTWINKPIRDIFVALHHAGHAHSVEVWDLQNNLMGGLYGLSLGAVFCGESMVSFQNGGSKIALVYLCAMLEKCGYTILDTQFINPHLLQFGAYEIPQEDYQKFINIEMKKSVRNLKNVTPNVAVLGSYLDHRKD